MSTHGQVAPRNTETHWTRSTSTVLNLSKNTLKNRGSLVTTEKINYVTNGKQDEKKERRNNFWRQYAFCVYLTRLTNLKRRHGNTKILLYYYNYTRKKSVIDSEHCGSVMRVFERGVIDHETRRARQPALTATH